MKAMMLALKRWARAIAVVIMAPAIPLPPHCCNISGLLMHMCDGDRDLHKWVLRWLALPLRHPGAKMSTCLAFNGPDARSLEILEYVLSLVYGSRAAEIETGMLPGLARQVPSYLATANMVCVRGGAGDHDVDDIAALKSLVSSKQIWVRDPYERGAALPNGLNFVFLSNHSDFLPVGMGNRRFTVIEMPPAPAARFHRAVTDEIDNGGIDAFRNYLMKDLDLGDHDTTTKPPEPTPFIPQPRAESHLIRKSS